MSVFSSHHKLKLCWQMEGNDCGPACIQMITGYYGKMYSLKTIKTYCNMTRLGISLRDVVHCLTELGFYAVSVTVNQSEARRMPTPAILYLKRGHFVVLEKVVGKKGKYEYLIADPSYGKVKMTEEDLSEKWMTNGWGVAVVMEPTGKFGDVESAKDDNEVVNRFMKITAKDIYHNHKHSLLWVAFLSLLVVVTNWAMPFLLKATIDQGIMLKDIGIVWTMLLAQFLFFIGFMISGNISSYLSTNTSIKINMRFTERYFSKIINLPMQYFDVGLRSDLIQRLSDLGRIESFVTGNLLSIVLAMLNVVVFSAILLYYNKQIFFLFIVFSLLLFLYNRHFMKKRKYLDYASFTIGSERQNNIYEMIMGMTEIKINNAQKARISVWHKIQEKTNRLVIKGLYLGYYMSNGTGLIGRVRDITLTAFCAVLVIEDNMSMGTMMMISFLLGQLTGPMGQLINFSQNIQDARLSYGRINEIYQKPEERADTDIDITREPITQGITFKNVAFKYAGLSSPYVLEDISLDIPIGKTTAIVGASGSGKTTLLKLILGFYSPDQGSILVNGIDLADIDLSTWRDKCGVVMQDGKIYSGTVAENIALADEEADTAKLQFAAEVACIDDRINILPMRFDTRIGETGIDLSGGEKQRIFIARAVYRNPDFIFFDEATSSLDANTERRIMHNLHEFCKGKTAVIIAHRLSTVKQADNIVFMDKGRIMEQGSHEQLLQHKGMYYNLVKNQLGLT